jgi:hypothetical protein
MENGFDVILRSSDRAFHEFDILPASHPPLRAT